MAWIFVLVAVVFIHELGHFAVARWCGVNVSTFSIGFGREILGFTDKKGTRWKLGWIPLGGYVKFMDDENAASVPSKDKLARMSDAERAGSFQGKPLWQRAAVVAAGPMANFLSAILIFAGTAAILGTQVIPAQVKVKPLNPALLAGLQTGDTVTRVDGKAISDYRELALAIIQSPKRELTLDIARDGAAKVVKVTPQLQEFRNGACKIETRGIAGVEPAGDSSLLAGKQPLPPQVKVAPHYVATLAGLQTGDIVVRVDGKPIATFTELSQIIAKSAGRELTFDVSRNGQPASIKLTPDKQTVPDGFGGTDVRGIIGIEPDGDRSKFPVTYPNVVDAISGGVVQSWTVITSTLGYFFDVFSGRQSADKIGGIATVIDVSNQIAKCDPEALIPLIGFLSVSIGLLNLFPIPLLDGGHLMYYAAEAIRGKPLSDEIQEFGFRIGLALVSMLMVLALWNDRFRIQKWISNLAGLMS